MFTISAHLPDCAAYRTSAFETAFRLVSLATIHKIVNSHSFAVHHVLIAILTSALSQYHLNHPPDTKPILLLAGQG
jgi:hypothetical protein